MFSDAPLLQLGVGGTAAECTSCSLVVHQFMYQGISALARSKAFLAKSDSLVEAVRLVMSVDFASSVVPQVLSMRQLSFVREGRPRQHDHGNSTMHTGVLGAFSSSMWECETIANTH